VGVVMERVSTCLKYDAFATDGTVRRITDMPLLDPIEEEWNNLFARANAGSTCQSFLYCSLAAKLALEAGRPTYLLTLRDSHALRAAWVLTAYREAHLTILRPASCGTHEEYSAPLLDSGGDLTTLAERMISLARQPPADRLMVYNCLSGSVIDRVMRTVNGATRCAIGGFQIRVDRFPTWDAVTSATSGKMLKEIRRRTNKLAKAGNNLAIGWLHTPEETEAAIRFFMSVKRQWLRAKREHSPWLAKDDVANFLCCLARASDLKTLPLAAAVRLDDKFVAVAFCLHNRDAIEMMLTGFDASFATFGPGKMLVNFLARWSVESGKSFDFGLLAAEYKEEWPVDEQPFHSYAVRLSWRGRIPTASEFIHALRVRLEQLRRRSHSFIEAQ